MLKKLKSLFIVEDENAKPDDAKTTPISEDTVAPISKGGSKVSSPSPAKPVSASDIKTNAKPDTKFLNSLLSAVEANNLEGFDYLEYKQALQSLPKHLDEKTRFESAYAMSKTMGATNVKLIQSGQHYINILNKEQGKFISAYNGKLESAKGTAQIKNLEQTVAQKKKQIEQLQKEIADSEKVLEKKKNDVNKSVAKVEQTKDKFLSAYKVVAGQIEQDIKKMQEYLK